MHIKCSVALALNVTAASLSVIMLAVGLGLTIANVGDTHVFGKVHYVVDGKERPEWPHSWPTAAIACAFIFGTYSITYLRASFGHYNEPTGTASLSMPRLGRYLTIGMTDFGAFLLASTASGMNDVKELFLCAVALLGASACVGAIKPSGYGSIGREGKTRTSQAQRVLLAVYTACEVTVWMFVVLSTFSFNPSYYFRVTGFLTGFGMLGRTAFHLLMYYMAADDRGKVWLDGPVEQFYLGLDWILKVLVFIFAVYVQGLWRYNNVELQV